MVIERLVAGVCPNCGSTEYDTYDSEDDDVHLIYNRICDKCGTEWDDVFRLKYLGYEKR